MTIPGRSSLQRDEPPTPQEYHDLFESNILGNRILESLIARFCGKIYVEGGHEADRQTAYNAGKRDVIEFIVSQINRANGVQPEGE